MPLSAVETGCVDLTLSPQEIGQHLERILANPRDFSDIRGFNTQLHRTTDLLQILLARTRVDFREYKESTVDRRIQRRMVTLGINDFDDYVAHCRASVDEVDALHRDLLISVTRFFRDPDQFRQLRQEIAELIQQRGTGRLRIWVAGCATGEEAYSIAILAAEAMGGPDALQRNDIQVFASDIDDRALDVARRGLYPNTAAHDIPTDLLEKYFKATRSSIEVIPQLRAVTLFSHHNVFQDPPFNNVDVVTLRNVLIYFNPALQERVLARVHYALAPNGLLFLGTSENVSALGRHFEARAHADKIYTKRRSSTGRDSLDPDTISRALVGYPSASTTRKNPRTDPDDDPSGQMFDALARAVAPNGFMITRANQIVRVFGDVTPMLELTETTALSLSIRILKPALRAEATSLIAIAFKDQSSRRGRWHPIEGPGFNQVRMVCHPIIASQGEDHMLVAFQTRQGVIEQAPAESLSDQERTQYILQIETEMQSTRETLQQTVEELQTANEELQSLNEEMESTNEELQATNEELQTSNEELESTNEELITVNDELRVNASSLQAVTTELEAMLRASSHPILVVDHALIVRRASENAINCFGLEQMSRDGVHLSQCTIPPDFPALVPAATQVFRDHQKQTIRVEGDESVNIIVLAPFEDPIGSVLGLTISVYNYETVAPATK